jgi:hypothetical protein
MEENLNTQALKFDKLIETLGKWSVALQAFSDWFAVNPNVPAIEEMNRIAILEKDIMAIYARIGQVRKHKGWAGKVPEPRRVLMVDALAKIRAELELLTQNQF